MRTLRLIKLLRLVRTSRVVTRVASGITLSTFTKTIVRLLFKLILCVHYYACVVGISASFAASKLDTWMATYGYCKPDGLDEDGERLASCVNVSYIYLQCVKWALGLICGGGFSMHPSQGPYSMHISDGRPLETVGSKYNVSEDVLVMVLKTFGLIIWALIFSSLIRAVSQADPDLVKYNNDVDALNRFCVHTRMPTDLAREFREYVSETRKGRLAESRTYVMQSLLSPVLKNQAAAILNEELMDFACFRLCRKQPTGGEFLCELTMKMKTKVFAPKDSVPPGMFYLVTEGSAKRRGKVLGPGQCWGYDDIILQTHKRKILASATTYLHLQAIDRATFQSLVSLIETNPAFAHLAEPVLAFKVWVWWNAFADEGKDRHQQELDKRVKAQANRHLGITVTVEPNEEPKKEADYDALAKKKHASILRPVPKTIPQAILMTPSGSPENGGANGSMDHLESEHRGWEAVRSDSRGPSREDGSRRRRKSRARDGSGTTTPTQPAEPQQEFGFISVVSSILG